MRRTNEDKRRTVVRVLEDQEWSKWSKREIANACIGFHNPINDFQMAFYIS
jgi:hypothetical protein